MISAVWIRYCLTLLQRNDWRLHADIVKLGNCGRINNIVRSPLTAGDYGDLNGSFRSLVVFLQSSKLLLRVRYDVCPTEVDLEITEG